MVICFESNMLSTFFEAGIVDYLSLISFRHVVILESVISLLTFDLYDGAFLVGSFAYVGLLRPRVGSEIYYCVSLISFSHLVFLEPVICLRTFGLYNCTSMSAFVVLEPILPNCDGSKMIEYVKLISF